MDDPLIPPHVFPRTALDANPHIITITTERGGHIGWHIGPTPLMHSWTDRLCSKFLHGVMRSQSAAGDTRGEHGRSLRAKL